MTARPVHDFIWVPLLDKCGAALLLILTSPIVALAAALMLLEDGMPVLYRQKRIGRNGVPFVILKLRSMHAGESGAPLTASGDTRVTRSGKWLRRFKLDELPQLINVMRGEMSLIGPRPEIPEYVDFRDEEWRAVLRVRPGITDLASLAFRNEEELLGSVSDPEGHYRTVILPEKLRLNLSYQRSRSMVRDVKLLWMTARYSFFPRGFTRERIVRQFVDPGDSQIPAPSCLRRQARLWGDERNA